MTEPTVPEGLPLLDHPFAEVTAKAEELIKMGALTFQKFSCENCGNRLTMDEVNTFYTRGSCDQCDHVTDIEARGCNFLLVWPITEEGQTAVEGFIETLGD